MPTAVRPHKLAIPAIFPCLLPLTQVALQMHTELIQDAGPTGRSLVSVMLVAVFGFFTVRWLHNYLKIRQQIKGLPALHSGIEIMQSAIRAQLPHIPLICPARDYTIQDPWAKYEKARSEVIAATALTTDHAMYLLAGPEVVQDVCSKPNLFPKPTTIWRYQAINAFGVNIVSAAHGDEWKRHRGVVRSCFGEDIFENAFEKTNEAFDTMINGLGLQNGGVIPNTWRALERVTLIVISAAGFAMEMPWFEEETQEGDDSEPLQLFLKKLGRYSAVPFAEALQVVDDNMTHSLLTPNWVFKLPIANLHRIGRATRSLHKLIEEMAVSKRREVLRNISEKAALGEKVRPPRDLFGALVAAQIDAEAESFRTNPDGSAVLVGLHPSEVVGNISYKDVSSLTLVLAACYEALRLRDMSIFLPKVATEDCTLKFRTWDEDGNVTMRTHEIKRGSRIVIDTPATQRNPFHWPDPMKYDPTRHLPGNKHVFAGFSLGQRRCIGQRYAEVELVAFLSLLVKTYKLEPIRGYQGESKESMLTRMCTATEGMTLTPVGWPLKLVKRQ